MPLALTMNDWTLLRVTPAGNVKFTDSSVPSVCTLPGFVQLDVVA